jgi:hypothetical protein
MGSRPDAEMACEGGLESWPVVFEDVTIPATAIAPVDTRASLLVNGTRHLPVVTVGYSETVLK